MKTWRGSVTDVETDSSAPPVSTSGTSYFTQGLITNLLNPQIGVFYLAIMPGLFDAGDITVWLGALLGAIHGAIGLAFLSLVAVFTGAVRRQLSRPVASAGIELFCGICLLAFGLYAVIDALAALG